jgi:hypothetical protein
LATTTLRRAAPAAFSRTIAISVRAASRPFRVPVGTLRTPVPNRLSFDAWIWLVTRQDSFLDFAFQQAFDVRQQFVFIHANQGNGMTFLSGSGGPADAMHIVFRHIGQFVIDDMR